MTERLLIPGDDFPEYRECETPSETREATTLTTAQENFNVEGLPIHRIEKIRRTTILTRI